MSDRLLETEIKAITLNYLMEKSLLSSGNPIINEFTLRGYSRRLDLFLPNEKHFIAIEIKSEADSLYRLDGQVKKYLEYADKVVIVSATKHIVPILEIVPENVAVWEVYNSTIKVRQRGKISPINDKNKLLDLMKANELLKLSNQLGFNNPEKNRRSLVSTLGKISRSRLRAAVINSLAERFATTYGLFWKNIADSSVAPDDIKLLSPYREIRALRVEAQRKKELTLQELLLKTDEDTYLEEMAKSKNEIFGAPPKSVRQMIAA